jgi:Mrp family chromosome partitioning ATPase
MSNLITTTDIYEAAFYLIEGFKIEKVEIVNQNRKEMGKFSLSGDGIQKAQLVYFNGEASVNIMDFRRTYNQLTTLVGQAKRELRERNTVSQTPASIYGLAMNKIVFSNQKGGVGKTTCTRELGFYLSERSFKTLLIDTDPQANLSKSLVDVPGFGLYEALTGSDYEPEEIKPFLYLLSGDIKLAGLEKSLIGELDAYTRMKDLLSGETFQAYDFVLIDSPPSLGVLTVNALTASNYLIIPMNPSLYSMQGTTDLIGTMAKVKKNLNP